MTTAEMSTETNGHRTARSAAVGDVLTFTGLTHRGSPRIGVVVERVERPNVAESPHTIAMLTVWITDGGVGELTLPLRENLGFDLLVSIPRDEAMRIDHAPVPRVTLSDVDRAWQMHGMIRWTERRNNRISELRASQERLTAERRQQMQQHNAELSNLREQVRQATSTEGDERMEAFKAMVRTETFRVASQQGWCTPGMNETLRNLGLREYEYAEQQQESRRYTVPVRVEYTVYVDVSNVDGHHDIDDSSDAAQFADRMVERALAQGGVSDGEDISDDEDVNCTVSNIGESTTNYHLSEVDEEDDDSWDSLVEPDPDAARYPR